jgi:hypothetical protein
MRHVDAGLSPRPRPITPVTMRDPGLPAPGRSHVPPLDEIGNAHPYLGHLLIVTRRHVARLGKLTDDESAPIGRAAARIARALTDTGNAERVYSAVLGTGVPTSTYTFFPAIPAHPARSLGTRSPSGTPVRTVARKRSQTSPNGRSLRSSPFPDLTARVAVAHELPEGRHPQTCAQTLAQSHSLTNLS